MAYNIGDGSFDVDYIEAVFTQDDEEVTRMEEYHGISGYGPTAKCTTVTNVNSQRVYCREFFF